MSVGHYCDSALMSVHPHCCLFMAIYNVRTGDKVMPFVHVKTKPVSVVPVTIHWSNADSSCHRIRMC
jgi:hypothetical protein